MNDFTMDRRAAAQARADAAGRDGIVGRAILRDASHIPNDRARSLPFASQMRSEMVTRDDRQFYRVEGYATVYETRYEMWDMFGPYEEVVSRGAATQTLGANPDVVFLINHKGLALARTRGNTLELTEDEKGLLDVAYLNPERGDVKDLIYAIDDGVVTEQSFAFMIEEGFWSEDFAEFRIHQFDINRGDVSAVNYGANPYTSIAARQREMFNDLRRMPIHLARGAAHELQARSDWAEVLTNLIATGEFANPVRTDEQKGRSITLVEALLLDEN